MRARQARESALMPIFALNDTTEEEAPARVIRFGRPSNNVKIGIVGMPNVGKSSFFNLLSR